MLCDFGITRHAADFAEPVSVNLRVVRGVYWREDLGRGLRLLPTAYRSRSDLPDVVFDEHGNTLSAFRDHAFLPLGLS